MAKKFAEHNGLNLTKTNNDVLAEWDKNDIFHKSIDEREGCPQLSSSRDLHLLMATLVFTTCWRVVSRIRSTDTRR